MNAISYSVSGTSCGHCRAAITAEVSAVPGVEAVEVDLDTKLVAISGRELDREALAAAIDWPAMGRCGHETPRPANSFATTSRCWPRWSRWGRLRRS